MFTVIKAIDDAGDAGFTDDFLDMMGGVSFINVILHSINIRLEPYTEYLLRLIGRTCIVNLHQEEKLQNEACQYKKLRNSPIQFRATITHCSYLKLYLHMTM